MVNTQLAPAFVLVANGKDVSASLSLDTAGLTLTDNDGDVADELCFTVLGNFKRPAHGDTLDFYLGYLQGGVQKVGRYFVQTTERIDMHMLSVTATSVNWSERLKEERDAKYEATSVAGVAKVIADRHSLKLKTDCEDLRVAYLAQSDESDLAFLSRLAQRYDLVFNIKNETLTLLHRTKDGKKSPSLPSFVVDAGACMSVRIKHSNRTFYESARVMYRDTKANQTKEVRIGEKKPTLQVKEDYRSDDEAKAGGAAALAVANRGMKNGTLEMVGELICAGGVLVLTNAKEDSGEYTIKSVTHTLDESGWVVSVEVEA